MKNSLTDLCSVGYVCMYTCVVWVMHIINALKNTMIKGVFLLVKFSVTSKVMNL